MANSYDPNNPYLITSVFDPYSGNINPYRSTTYAQEYPEMAAFQTAPQYVPADPYKSMMPTFALEAQGLLPQPTSSPYMSVADYSGIYPPSYQQQYNQSQPYYYSSPQAGTNSATGQYSSATYSGTPMSGYASPNYVPQAQLGRYDNDVYGYWNQANELFKGSAEAYKNDPSIKAYKDLYDYYAQNAYDDAIGQMTQFTGGMLNSAAAGAAASAKQRANLELAAQLPAILSQQRNDYLNYLQFGASRGDAEYGRFVDDRNFAASENQRAFDKNLTYGQQVGYMPEGMLDTGAYNASPYGGQTVTERNMQAQIQQAQQELAQAQAQFQQQMALAERAQTESERAAREAEALAMYNAETNRIAAKAKQATTGNTGTPVGLDLLGGSPYDFLGGDDVINPIPDTQKYKDMLNSHKNTMDTRIASGKPVTMGDVYQAVQELLMGGVPTSEVYEFAKKYGLDLNQETYNPYQLVGGGTPTPSPSQPSYTQQPSTESNLSQQAGTNSNITAFYTAADALQKRDGTISMAQLASWVKDMQALNIPESAIIEFARKYGFDIRANKTVEANPYATSTWMQQYGSTVKDPYSTVK